MNNNIIEFFKSIYDYDIDGEIRQIVFISVGHGQEYTRIMCEITKGE